MIAVSTPWPDIACCCRTLLAMRGVGKPEMVALPVDPACRSARMAHVVSSETSVPLRSATGIKSIMVMRMPVPSAVTDVDGRTVVVVVPVSVVGVDGEVPATSPPKDGAYEIVGSHHQVVLPVVEDAAQVRQAA